MKKRDVIYQAAAEAVMLARVEIRQAENLVYDKIAGDQIDEILSRAQHQAGVFALLAVDADARKTPSVQALVRDYTQPQEPAE